MRPLQACAVALGVGAAVLGAHGLSIPVQRRAMPHSTSVHMTTSTPDDDEFGFQNIGNILYTGILDVGGHKFTVQIDTGSSDLWVDSQNVTLEDVSDTGVSGGIVYVDLTAAIGPIKTGSVQFGEFVVPNQAFIDAPGSNATSGGLISGLIGVGPPLLSQVDKQLQEAGSKVDGSSFLDNVFAYYPDEPNIMTFMLSRSEMGTVDGGIFTIGDVVSNFSQITSTQKLPVVARDNWFTFMDAVDINGERLFGGSLGSSEVDIPQDKVLALLDSGTSLATAPPGYVEAMYNVTGSVFDTESGFWVVPCETQINVSMVFGQDTFPVDPLDLISPAGTDDDGNVICVGVFQNAPANSGVDFILGDTFMRNVYSLFDFGNFAKVGDSDPFIQLLSLTNADQAAANYGKLNADRVQAFINAHPDQFNNTGAKDISGALGGDANNNGNLDLNNLTRLSYVIIGLLSFVVMLLIGTVVSLLVKGKNSGGKGYNKLKDPYPPAHEKPYEGSYSDYSTPYNEGGHQ